MPKFVGFIGEAYSTRAKIVDCQELVNLYPQVEKPNSKTVMSLIGTPGTTLFSTVTANSGNRGMHTTSNGKVFTVIFNEFWELFADGSKTLRGNIGTTNGQVSMADNGSYVAQGVSSNQVMIVDGLHGYIYDISDNSFITILEVLDITNTYRFHPASHVVFMDGFFICNRLDTTGQFAISDLYDGTKWQELNYFTAEGNPDIITALSRGNNELWVFGEHSIELWYNTGDSSQQFARISGTSMNMGVQETDTICTNSTPTPTIFFLGQSDEGAGIVYKTSGFTPQRISNHGIEYQIGQIADKTGAYGWTYQQEGHYFYALSFPTADKTFVYDDSTNMWHERNSYNSTINKTQLYRICNHIFAFGKHLVGDYYNGDINELSLDYYDENGTLIERIRTAPHIHKDRERVTIRELEIDMEKGFAPLTGQGSAPLCWFQISKDGGYTFGNRIYHSIPLRGNYFDRVHLHNLGMSRDFVIRFGHSEPIKTVLVGATIEAKV